MNNIIRNQVMPITRLARNYYILNIIGRKDGMYVSLRLDRKGKNGRNSLNRLRAKLIRNHPNTVTRFNLFSGMFGMNPSK